VQAPQATQSVLSGEHIEALLRASGVPDDACRNLRRHWEAQAQQRHRSVVCAAEVITLPPNLQASVWDWL
jgi:hypothetical protein